MADEEQLAILRQGATAWNAWRAQHSQADVDLSEANLSRADLREADLTRANLWRANLAGANLTGASLWRASLIQASLTDANLSEANLSRAHLSGADLTRADLNRTDLIEAILSGAILSGADLSRTDLSGADLTRADLRYATLVEADLTQATLSGCRVYGISAWGLQLEGAVQSNLIINAPGQPTITVDDLEVAQFLYLMLHNQKIRRLIDSLTSKVVLILGRFTPERMAVLDALREALRTHNYVPVLFDFEGPQSLDFTETVTLLARMARFIVTDLTEPNSIPQELQAIVPHVAVPVQPLIAQDAPPFAMFADYRKYPWALPVYRYASLEDLLATLHDKVIAPAEAKVIEVQALKQPGTSAT